MQFVSKGPNFTHCGKPVEWSASAGLDERFPEAVATAIDAPGVDIELCRWEPDDPIADQYTAWWSGQRAAIKRHVTTVDHPGLKVMVRRAPARMADGWVVCYVRADRARPKAVAA